MARSRAQKQAYWRRMLRRQGQSGLSGRRFCSTHQLSEASFYYWKRKIADLDRDGRGSTRANTVDGVGTHADTSGRPRQHAGTVGDLVTRGATVGGIIAQAKAGSGSASAPTQEAAVPKDNGLRKEGTCPKEGAPVFIPVRVGSSHGQDRSAATRNEPILTCGDGADAVMRDSDVPPQAGGGLEVVHPRGYVVRVPPVVDENVLRQVLGVLDGQRLA